MLNVTPNVMIKNLSESLDEYKWVSDYSIKHTVNILKDEIAMCKEMSQLLPRKVTKTMPDDNFRLKQLEKERNKPNLYI